MWHFNIRSLMTSKLEVMNEHGVILVVKFEKALTTRYTKSFLCDTALKAVSERYPDALNDVGYSVALRYNLEVKSLSLIDTPRYNQLRATFK